MKQSLERGLAFRFRSESSRRRLDFCPFEKYSFSRFPFAVKFGPSVNAGSGRCAAALMYLSYQ
jgi:hypothetical protein